MWPRKGSLIKTQKQILDIRLYYSRKIEFHRKGKKSRTVRLTPILICLSGSEISSTNNCEKSPLWGDALGSHNKYIKPFNCVETNDLWLGEYVTQNLFVYTSCIFNVYVCTGFGIESPKIIGMSSKSTKPTNRSILITFYKESVS